ncbi:MAG: hypothetical protein AAF939_02345, partial [Planctomycetota bacterium]
TYSMIPQASLKSKPVGNCYGNSGNNQRIHLSRRSGRFLIVSFLRRPGDANSLSCYGVDLTAQASDSIEYQGSCFSICGVNGQGLLTPEHFGETPVMMSTACWRGYICTYAIEDSRLLLSGLIFRNESNTYASINDVNPSRKNIFEAGEYEGLNEPCPFSGGLLIADGFIRDLYVHMGFHPAWKFETVHELIFDNGKLIKERDCSEFMSQIRQEMSGSKMQPDHTDSRKRIEEWVKQTFTLDYKL